MSHLHLTGTPTIAGTNTATIAITDANGNTATVNIGITVVAIQTPLPPVMEVLSHQLGEGYSASISLLPNYTNLSPLAHSLTTGYADIHAFVDAVAPPTTVTWNSMTDSAWNTITDAEWQQMG